MNEITDNNSSLVSKALATELKRRGSKQVNADERALAMAWVSGKVSITQVAGALGTKTGGVYPFLANALKAELLSKF